MAGLITKLRDLSSGSSSKKKTKNKKYDSDSIYSVVSCSDLTPGSLEIWVDLPNEIKYDASLAPFKQLYEHHHGKLESETASEGDKSIFVKRTTELETIGEVDSNEPGTRESPTTTGERLIDGPANEEKKQESARKKRISRLLHIGKMAFLIACWLLLMTALLLNRETSDVVLHTAVQAGIVKEYALEPSSGQVKVLIKLTGPFQQNDDLETNSSEHGVLRVWLQRSRSSSLRNESSTYWEIPLQPDSVIDFSRSEVVSKILKLQSDGKFTSTRRAEFENETVSNDTNDRVIENDTGYQGRRDIDQESLKYHHNEIQEFQGELDAAVQRDEDIEQRNYNSESQDAIDLDKTQDERRDYSEKGVLGVRSGDVVRKQKYHDWDRNTSVTTSASSNNKKVEVASNERKEINTLKGSNRFDSPDRVRDKRESSVKGRESKDNLILSVTIKDKSDVVDFKNSSNITEKETLNLLMDTTSNATVPVTLTYKVNPLGEDGVVYAAILLCFLYVLIIFEIVNRTVAALLSSSLGIAVLALAGSRPSLGELVSWLDVETLLLLFSMMLLVAILAETGLFDYLAVVAFEVTGGRTWPLINCLCLFTAVFSTFLDNVTTVLLMTPVTIRLCEVMQLNPIPVLMSMVVFSNVGGAATPVGDPPNVIIANHPAVLAQGINFVTFTAHMSLGILLVSVQTYLQLRFMFRDIRKLRHNVPHDIQELRQEIAVWRRAAASLSSYSRDEDLVRKALEKKVERLQKALARKEAGGGSKTDPRFCSTLAQMKQKYRIRDKMLLIKSTICTIFVVVVFFLHCIPELQRLSLGWTALLGALLLLLLADHDDLEPILARVEWSTLLFFAALFVLMEVLSKLGLITWIGNITEMIIRSVSEESKLAVALMLVLWVSGIASAFVDNIPLTTMMVRVVAALAAPDGLALPLAPLAWALSFGACLGGNGTLIGASANVVCAGVAEQHGYRFTFMQFFRVGFPLMLGHLIVASVYLLICHCAFTWH